MGNFFEWFFVFISEILKGFASIFKGFWEGIKQIFNIKNYIDIIKYGEDDAIQFSAMDFCFT